MGDFLGSVWWLIVVLGVLVSFHEFGHFCSIGFGRPLWRRLGKDGTEYVVAAIPLGGYVKMLDEREAPVAADELDQAFNRKPLGQRTAIVAAGPIFNLILALATFWLMFMVGVLEIRPLVGDTEGLARDAGLKELDTIVAVDGQPTQTVAHASIALLGHALDREAVDLTVEDIGGNRRELRLPLDRLSDDFREEDLLNEIGIGIYRPAAVISEVTDDSPAQYAGFESGDRIVAVGDEPVTYSSQLTRLIQGQGKRFSETGQPVVFGVDRNGETLQLQATPRIEGEGEQARYLIGVSLYDPNVERLYTIFQHGPWASLTASAKECQRITSATLGLIARMVTGSASLRNLQGPISIAQFARDSARLGLSRFLFFLGVLSLSLAILNFLPIPLLDGGHLMYYLIEWLKGSPVSDQTQLVGQYVGLVALAGLMCLTFYNDILRLMS
jgi:regulator of sigma E protease